MMIPSRTSGKQKKKRKMMLLMMRTTPGRRATLERRLLALALKIFYLLAITIWR